MKCKLIKEIMKRNEFFNEKLFEKHTEYFKKNENTKQYSISRLIVSHNNSYLHSMNIAYDLKVF